MISYFLVLLTVLITYLADKDASLKSKLIFHPYRVRKHKEYYRFFTSGLIHADLLHLGFNLFVFVQFGPTLERYFEALLGGYFGLAFVLLYFGGMAAADMSTYLSYCDQPGYRSLGASGSVSAVLMSFIMIDPWSVLQPLIFPIEIYSLYIAIAYLLYSYFAGRYLMDNINHDAHLFGAIFGILFTFALEPRLITRLLNSFAT